VISSEHVKALIRNRAKASKINSNIILRIVIFEFFLEKLSKSTYKDRFIIKGGFLVSAITRIELRTTMDLDVTLKALSIQKNDLKTYIEEIITIPTRDKLVMELVNIDEIHEDVDYPGLRASIIVLFDGLRETIKIDFTTGDALTPSEANFTYKTILYDRDIELKSYNIETVLAEKIETILTRGLLNTRMRDFYDVYILWKLRKNEVDTSLLKTALINTSKYRKTYDQIFNDYFVIISSIEQDPKMINLWQIYQNSYPFAKDVSWENSINSIKSIMKDITSSMGA
jgi:predicted nucleotidyltransferase component of viral defense system